MNIDEFRAMKAEMEKSQEEGKPDAQTEPTTTEQVSPTQEETTEGNGTSEQETKPTETNQTEKPPAEDLETKPPETIEIDGKEYTIDELKNGYMRQSDYTKKTQEARRKEEQAEQAIKFMEQLQANPQIAQQLSQQFNMPTLDPQQAQFTDLENKYYDLLIKDELRDLHDKYGEFEESEVLEIARDNKLNDLDTAYHVLQSRKGGGRTSQENQVDPEQIKEQLRQELLAELKAEQEANVDTSTVIQPGGGAPLQDTTPQLSQQEQKVARMMGMNTEEYAKWRDVKKKK